MPFEFNKTAITTVLFPLIQQYENGYSFYADNSTFNRMCFPYSCALLGKKMTKLGSMLMKLQEANSLASFNQIFAENYSEIYSFHTDTIWKESPQLTTTERLLKNLRRNANDEVEDMFVDVMHCLSQRLRVLENTNKPEHQLLQELTNKIRGIAREVQPVTAIAFYIAIIHWEKQNTSLSLTSKSTDMLKVLKNGLLNQAFNNHNISLAEKDVLIVSALQNAVDQLNITARSLVNTINGVNACSEPTIPPIMKENGEVECKNPVIYYEDLTASLSK